MGCVCLQKKSSNPRPPRRATRGPLGSNGRCRRGAGAGPRGCLSSSPSLLSPPLSTPMSQNLGAASHSGPRLADGYRRQICHSRARIYAFLLCRHLPQCRFPHSVSFAGWTSIGHGWAPAASMVYGLLTFRAGVGGRIFRGVGRSLAYPSSAVGGGWRGVLVATHIFNAWSGGLGASGSAGFQGRE